MKSTGDSQLDRIEFFLNEIQADTQVLQIMFQHFLSNMLLASPQRRETWHLLRAQVLHTLESAPNVSDDPQDGERLKRLIVARAERVFRPIDIVFGTPPKEGPVN